MFSLYNATENVCDIRDWCVVLQHILSCINVMAFVNLVLQDEKVKQDKQPTAPPTGNAASYMYNLKII